MIGTDGDDRNEFGVRIVMAKRAMVEVNEVR